MCARYLFDVRYSYSPQVALLTFNFETITTPQAKLSFLQRSIIPKFGDFVRTLKLVGAGMDVRKAFTILPQLANFRELYIDLKSAAVLTKEHRRNVVEQALTRAVWWS